MTNPSHPPAGDQPTGRWYFVITWVSAGLLAAVPFFHAAAHLDRPELRKAGTGYAIASLVGFVMMAAAPTDEAGDPTGWLSNMAVILLLVVMIAATLQQIGLRREVYPPPGRPRPLDRNRDAVSAIQAARAKRADARRLAEQDPLMARELRIGRPDLARGYDDGGLVDLNAAPVEVLATGFELPSAVAESLLTARENIGRFGSVEEALLFGNVPENHAQLVRERGIVLPESN
jgi:hypothetical protein